MCMESPFARCRRCPDSLVPTTVRASVLSRPMHPIAQRILRYRTHLVIALAAILTLLALFDSHSHSHAFDVARSEFLSDPIFFSNASCEDADETIDPSNRLNAVIVMLARNDDLEEAKQAVRSFEQRFNRRFQYPILFLNNEPWSESFIQEMRGEVSGESVFDTIPVDMWSLRAAATEQEREQARKNMQKMQEKGVPHAGSEDYHNMCRFYSGFFFDHPALQSFSWFWRIEPDARVLCDIPYDPFAEMLKHNKTYGYTIALWEVGASAPSLFREVSDYRISNDIVPSSLWTAMLEPSWAPMPLRHTIMPWFPSRDGNGDAWSSCHFWSNFEIADFNFFRSTEYRSFFQHLDATGGFHLERWGDAAVHSLALALFLEPEKLHYFEDFGYRHDALQHCPPANLRQPGCGCTCDEDQDGVPDTCLRRLREPVEWE